MYVDTHRMSKGPAILVTYQDPALGAFGQSAPARPAVTALQRALRAYATSTGDMDYHPGPADGAYGMNTHAAVIRFSRDVLEPAGIVSRTCRSTCNTLRSSSKAFCKDCLAQMLTSMADARLPGLSLSGEDVGEIAAAYGEWLDAYIARYGEGGELDPAQIARREDVSLEEAARLAAERSGATPGGDTVAVTEIPSGGPAMAAKFPWLAVLLVAGVLGGTAAAGWYYSRGKPGVVGPVDRRPTFTPSPRPWRGSGTRAYRPSW
jgi:peptidoglycan hydrolase-like protein with peptidoglycan-binding domain